MRFLRLVAFCAVVAGASSACARSEPAILGEAQEIVLEEQVQPAPNQSSVTISAHATSGLAVTFSTMTPDICSVGTTTGVATAKASGTCSIEVTQDGNAQYAPALPVTTEISFVIWSPLSFGNSPALSLYDLATVKATGATDVTIGYASETPSSCSIDAKTGQVIAKSLGTCTITATDGNQSISQSIEVTALSSVGVPGTPTGLTASLVGAADRASVGVGALASGGDPVTGFTITSVPAGITASVASLPAIVTCPSGCAGYAFQIAASNRLGAGPSSTAVEVVTKLRVEAVFFEPDCQPNDSVFVGEYTLNSSTRSVSGLRGKLSESMTGSLVPYPNDTMIWLPLEYHLSSLPVTLSGVPGLLVTSFLLNDANTLSSDLALGGTDGWEPGTGRGLYYGYPGENPGNAYVRIFVNTTDPFAQITDEQLAKLAYADCTKGGMMGATCMTGTSVAGYGSIGTMSGYPLSQRTLPLDSD